MGVTRYNRVYKWSLAFTIIYTIVCLVSVFADIPVLDGIISKTILLYLAYSIVMIVCKIRMAFKYMLGGLDTIINIVVHGVFAFAAAVMALIVL